MPFGDDFALPTKVEGPAASRRLHLCGETGEVGDGESLGARRGTAAGVHDAAFVENPPERGLERLAPPGEEVANERLESGALVDLDQGPAVRLEAKENGFDPRAGPKMRRPRWGKRRSTLHWSCTMTLRRP